MQIIMSDNRVVRGEKIPDDDVTTFYLRATGEGWTVARFASFVSRTCTENAAHQSNVAFFYIKFIDSYVDEIKSICAQCYQQLRSRPKLARACVFDTVRARVCAHEYFP